MNQAEAAALLGVSAQQVSDAESGSLPDRDARGMLSSVQIEEPSTGELCALARRRSGMTLESVHLSFGASRTTYLERECAGDALVVRHWVERGFVF